MKFLILILALTTTVTAQARPAEKFPGVYKAERHSDCAQGTVYEVKFDDRNDLFEIKITGADGRVSHTTFPATVRTQYILSADKKSMEVVRQSLYLDGEIDYFEEKGSEGFFERKRFVDFEGNVGEDNGLFENKDLLISGDGTELVYAEMSGDGESDPHEYTCVLKRIKN